MIPKTHNAGDACFDQYGISRGHVTGMHVDVNKLMQEITFIADICSALAIIAVLCDDFRWFSANRPANLEIWLLWRGRR